MDEREFNRLLALFPVVRYLDFCVDEWHDAWDNGDKIEQNDEGIDLTDAFWKKLRLAVESKVGGTEAEKFCRALQQVHRKLVYEVMSIDAAKEYINSSSFPEE